MTTFGDDGSEVGHQPAEQSEDTKDFLPIAVLIFQVFKTMITYGICQNWWYHTFKSVFSYPNCYIKKARFIMSSIS